MELRSLIERAVAEQRPILSQNVNQPVTGGSAHRFDVSVTPLVNGSDGLLGVAIDFIDVTRVSQLQEELNRSSHDLETAYEELESSNEELTTTNEELQSTVEELETTNEELQSTNEELETINEELQSTNEELQTVNLELRDRTDELNRTSEFMEGVLTNLDTGVVVIDSKWSILIWNDHMEDLWGLRADEVQGESLFNLDIGLPVELLRNPIRACLTSGDRQALVLEAINRRGKSVRLSIGCSLLAVPSLDDGERRLGVLVTMDGASGGMGISAVGAQLRGRRAAGET